MRYGGNVDNIFGFLNRLGIARVAAMGVVTVLLFGFFAFLILRFTSPQMAPLYSGLNFDDSSAIVTELQSMNVPYQLRAEGETILIPRDQITTTRMTLAENGLPTRGQVGYEIFDEQNTLGATSFVQNINQLRALEGELARTIASLARIRSARVHLVLPERELFRRERQDPSASIMLTVRGELSAGEIRAIQHLTASAIENLSPNSVSIVDDSGRLLASGAGSEDENLVAGQMEERLLGMETRIRNRIETMLDDVVGPGRARVQVAAELDTDRLTRTSETFDPESQVVRSTQTSETNEQSSTPATNDGVTVGNELPGAEDQAGGNGQATDQSSAIEETINYEISRTTQTEVEEAGGIKRLSVAVVVDGRYVQDETGGAVTYEPRSDEELTQLTTLVRSAVGFDETRGDTVEVINMQFAERPGVEASGTAAPGMFDFTRDDLMNMMNMAVTVLIALALMFFVLRPLLRRVLEPEAEPLALPHETEVHVPKAVQDAQDAADAGAVNNLEYEKPQWIDQARNLGEAQMQTVKSVGTLVEENPRAAAVIVRDWLTQAA